MNDLISRQAVLDKFEPWLKVKDYNDGELNVLKAILYEIRFVPPATDKLGTNLAEVGTDSISRQQVIGALRNYLVGKNVPCDGTLTCRLIENEVISKLPSAQPGWIPCSERLPEERDWYLGIFKEPDTGWINPIPFICDYLLGTKTKATTKEGWILKGHTDREEYIDYYFNLECVAWMPLPEPYKGGEKDE